MLSFEYKKGIVLYNIYKETLSWILQYQAIT